MNKQETIFFPKRARSTQHFHLRQRSDPSGASAPISQQYKVLHSVSAKIQLGAHHFRGECNE